MKVFQVILGLVLLLALIVVNVIVFPALNTAVHNFLVVMPNIMSPTGLLIIQNAAVTNVGYAGFFIPASMTFFIWLIIYIMLFYFSVNQVVCLIRKKDTSKAIDSTAWWFAISSAINIIWYVAWYFDLYMYSVFIIIALLLVLMIVYSRLHTPSLQYTVSEALFIKLPFSLYLGWVSVMTLLNTVYYTQAVHWHNFGLSDTVWTVMLMGILALAAILMLVTNHDYGYAAVMIWTFAGLLVKRYGDAIPQTGIIIGAWICIAAVLISGVLTAVFATRRKKRAAQEGKT